VALQKSIGDSTDSTDNSTGDVDTEGGSGTSVKGRRARARGGAGTRTRARARAGTSAAGRRGSDSTGGRASGGVEEHEGTANRATRHSDGSVRLSGESSEGCEGVTGWRARDMLV
jgi:hypothetical protein